MTNDPDTYTRLRGFLMDRMRMSHIYRYSQSCQGGCSDPACCDGQRRATQAMRSSLISFAKATGEGRHRPDGP